MINIIKPQPKPITEEVMAKHVFSVEERLELSQKLAASMQKSAQIENEKKQVMSGYKAQLDALSSNENSLATQIANGYEMRNTPCIVTMEYNTGKKLYHHRTSGELIYEAAMSQTDYQQKLPLQSFEWNEDGTCKNPILVNVHWGNVLFQIQLASSSPSYWYYGTVLNMDNPNSKEGNNTVNRNETSYPTAHRALNAANIELGGPSNHELQSIEFADLPPGTVLEHTIEESANTVTEETKVPEKPKRRKKSAEPEPVPTT